MASMPAANQPMGPDTPEAEIPPYAATPGSSVSFTLEKPYLGDPTSQAPCAQHPASCSSPCLQVQESKDTWTAAAEYAKNRPMLSEKEEDCTAADAAADGRADQLI